MTDYERGYKDGMAGAALPNIIDNGDKIDGYAYSYKTDSEGVPYINIDSVRAMLTKAATLYECYVDSEGYERCSHCNEHETGMRYFSFCPRCGVRLKH